MRTFISWQGNKSKHINKFIKYIPEFNGKYYEPFIGSGELLLKLEQD
jgi:DNA adenine methylase